LLSSASVYRYGAGRFEASNATLAALFDGFEGVEGAYRQLHLISASCTGRRGLGPLVRQ
jgi:hypothetical protein